MLQNENLKARNEDFPQLSLQKFQDKAIAV